MIAINRDEKMTIEKVYPHIHFVRTMKHDSKRHHYYMEEAAGAMTLLRKLRGEQVPERRRNRKRGHDRNRKGV